MAELQASIGKKDARIRELEVRGTALGDGKVAHVDVHLNDLVCDDIPFAADGHTFPDGADFVMIKFLKEFSCCCGFMLYNLNPHAH